MLQTQCSLRDRNFAYLSLRALMPARTRGLSWASISTKNVIIDIYKYLIGRRFNSKCRGVLINARAIDIYLCVTSVHRVLGEPIVYSLQTRLLLQHTSCYRGVMVFVWLKTSWKTLIGSVDLSSVLDPSFAGGLGETRHSYLPVEGIGL